MKIVQKDDSVSSMEHSQQLLDSEDEKQAETVVKIQSQNTSKETYNPRKKIANATGYL
jgi:flagellar basal body rod protein FlgC